jgi:hypothetical protein
LFQFAEISASALDEPPLAAGVELAAADSPVGEVVTSEADDPGVDWEELEPLEQAAIAVTSTRPSAGAR